MKSVEEIKKDFLNDLNKWQNIVRGYELYELQKQPGPTQWSIGQVIGHFILETNWYFSQAGKALLDVQNLQRSKSNTIIEWFAANSFPNEHFKGPEDIDEPSQPISVNQLIDTIEGLKNNMLNLADLLSKKTAKGKSEHPGHGFLTALEWFQYAEMHCRHHFRQKQRITEAIKKTDK